MGYKACLAGLKVLSDISKSETQSIGVFQTIGLPRSNRSDGQCALVMLDLPLLDKLSLPNPAV